MWINLLANMIKILYIVIIFYVFATQSPILVQYIKCKQHCLSVESQFSVNLCTFNTELMSSLQTDDTLYTL